MIKKTQQNWWSEISGTSPTFLTNFYLMHSMLFWGLSFIWFKQALMLYTPLTIIILRLQISFLILLFLAWITKKLNKIDRKDWPYFLGLAFFEPFVYFLGEGYGMLYVSSTVASVIIATIPILTPFTAFLIYGERIKANNYLGIFVSFAGVLLVVLKDVEDGHNQWIGILLMFIAVLATQGYTILLLKLSKKYTATTIVAFQNMIGMVYFLPLFLLFDLNRLSLRLFTFNNLIPIFYLSVFASGLAFLFFTRGIKAVGMSKATVFTNFIPVFTAIFAFFILHEDLSIRTILGIIIVIFGLFMSQAAGFPLMRIFNRVK